MIKEIHSEETGKLYECLEALAEHHNKVSVHFKGSYPKTPSEERIKQFESKLEEGKSRIAVIENGNDFVGFCKIGTATYQVRTGQNKAIRDRITPLNSLMINFERRETG